MSEYYLNDYITKTQTKQIFDNQKHSIDCVSISKYAKYVSKLYNVSKKLYSTKKKWLKILTLF